MNLNQLTGIFGAMTAFMGVGTALAQSPVTGRTIDYFSNKAPIQGTAPRPLMAGSLWQVRSSGLNCRSQAGVTYATTRWFQKGEILQVDVSRGGSDEVLSNAKDKHGQPWMRVRSPQGQDYNCYVRANSLYIQPYKRKSR